MVSLKFNRFSPKLIVLLPVLLVAVFLVGYLRIHEQHVASEFDDKLNTVENHYRDSLHKQWQTMAAAMVILEHDSRFIDALAETDRDLLQELSAGFFRELRDEFNITHLYFTHPDRVNLLRVHQPQRHGDTINRKTTLEAEATGRLAHGLELGPLGTFTLRVVAPWRQSGRLIGYVEMGAEIEHIIGRLKPLFDIDVLFLLNKNRVNQSGWEEGMRMLGRTANWRQLSDHVVVFSTSDAVEEIMVRHRLGAVNKTVKIDGYRFMTGRIPISDVAGVDVGELLIVKRLDPEHDYEYDYNLWTSALFLLLGSGVVALLFGAFKLADLRIRKTKRKLDETRKEWAEALNSLQDPVFLHDADLNIIHANQAYLEAAGLDRSEVVGRPYWEVFPKMHGPFRSCNKVTTDQTEEVCEEELSLADGKVYASRSYPVIDETSGYRYSIHLLHDITEKKEFQEKLRLAEIVFDNTVEGVIVTNSNCEILTINRGFTEITGYGKDEVIGKMTSLLKSGRHADSFYEAMWDTLNTAGHWQGEIWNRHKDGSVYPEWLTITKVLRDDNQTSHYIGIFADLTEIKATQEQVNILSNYDSLTALPNRHLLSKHLERLVYRAGEHGKSLAVLLVDLNQFANINETLGHKVGDMLLFDVAERLTSMVRTDDLAVRLDPQLVKNESEINISRIAGDEFAIVLEDIADAVSSADVVQRILDNLASAFLVDGNEIFLTASIGVSIFPDDEHTAEGLLKCAHTAANLAKQRGRNNYQYYTEDFTASAVERLNLERGLRNAIANHELFLNYQPQVSMDTGRIIGFEALVRWRHPEIGLISPVKFIPLAEESGLILSIGEWVLHSACSQVRQWHDAGLSPGVMAVNISGMQIQHSDLVSVVRRVIDDTGVQPGLLELELTESAVMKSQKRAISQLSELKSLGISLAIDDFGTGYSSLSHLLQFPFDKLKIDRSFITNISTDPDDAVLVRAIITMARGMRLYVLAEGIETEEQLYYLRRNGCDALQGYYFSPPVDMPAAEQLLINKHALQFSTDSTKELQLTLLLVDDEENITQSLKRLLRNEGYRILTANHARDALQIMAVNDVHVILCDQQMPEMSGTQLFKQIRDLYPDTIRMILSGHADMQTVTEAINSGWIYKFLTKPFDNGELKVQIKDAFDTFKRNRIEKIQRL